MSQLLLALPAVVMFGYTMYLKRIHDGIPESVAQIDGWTYGISASGIFIAAYLTKLAFAA